MDDDGNAVTVLGLIEGDTMSVIIFGDITFVTVLGLNDDGDIDSVIGLSVA